MSEWREYKLGEITSKIGSGATPTGGGNSYKDSGIALIRSQNVYDFHFDVSGLAYIDSEQAKLLNNVSVQENDILMDITGESVTRCCLAPSTCIPARVSQHVSIIRPKTEKADYKYVFYYLQSIKPELNIMAEIGCTRRALTKQMLEALFIPLPPLPEQQAIAGVLSSLDDKIDLLHRQNKTLEGLAEALWRKMFVEEADPGWKKGRLGDLMELCYGKGLKEEKRMSGKYPVIGSSGIVGYHNEFLVKGPGIVIGRKGTLGIVNYIEENFFPIDTTYFIKSRTNSGRLFFEYFLLKEFSFVEINSDSAVPGLNRESAESMEFVIPNIVAVLNFNEWCQPLFEKIAENDTQIRTLSHLRDTLLPKLMSGEVRVKV